jgi:PPP family 3-phenylpropionic acid transporter
MFAYALMMPAGVYYINERIDAADRVKGQSLFTIAMVAAAMIADLFGGMMLDSIGVHMTLLVCLIITAAGAAVIFATVDRI